MSSSIKNATIWVTGASSGIGKALVEKLAAEKNFVIASARNTDALTVLEQRFKGNVVALPVDVTEHASTQAIRAKLADVTDHIDIVIMSAGTCEYDNGPDLDYEMYHRVMNVNYFGVLNTVRAALPFVHSAVKHGSRQPKLVAISSMAALAPFPRAEAYGASKAAVEYLMQSLAVDLKPKGIDVAIVRPGFVDTPLTQKNDFDMPWIINADSAAAKILDSLKKSKLFIQFPWPMSFSLGLGRLFPSLWLKKVAPKLIKKDVF